MKAKLIDNIYKRKNHYVFKDNWYIINPKRKCQNGKEKYICKKNRKGSNVFYSYCYGKSRKT